MSEGQRKEEIESEGRERKTERETERSRAHVHLKQVTGSPSVGLKLTDCEIMS